MSRKRLAVALFALALVTSACVRRGDPGIGLQDVQTDVEFAAVRGAPANARPSTTPATAEPPDPSEFDFGKDFLDRLPPTTATQTSCQEAPVSAAPAQEASLGAKGTPKVGVYRWNRSGEQKITTPIPLTIPLGGTEKRLIRNVQQLGGGDFTYEMAQSEVGTDEIVVTTFKVRPDAPNAQLPSTDQRVGAVDRGLSIVKIERFNSKSGQLVSAFEPITPVLMLPLPVLPGEQVQSSGVDPTSFNVLQINAQVTKRVRIDACGEVVDGWSVEGTRSFSQGSTAGTPHEYDFVVATQLGAMMISEHIKATSAQASIDATFSLGQLEPDPLPEAEKTTG